MSDKKPPLTQEKKRWAKNRDVNLLGKTLNYNASIQTWYSRSLLSLIDDMTADVEKQVKKLFKKLPVTFLGTTDDSVGSQARILMNKLLEKYTELFTKASYDLADEMLDKTTKVSESNLHASLKELSGGLSIKTSIVPPELKDVITASIAENVSLIKSIPQQYLKDVTGAVMRSITSGQGVYDLLPEIKKYAGVTERRAYRLALDQTRKAYTSINVAKMNKLGVKSFQWVHSGGGQTPRASHIAIKGKVFTFANVEAEQAALGVPKSDRGLPGYPINCRCSMKPIITFEDREDV